SNGGRETQAREILAARAGRFDRKISPRLSSSKRQLVEDAIFHCHFERLTRTVAEKRRREKPSYLRLSIL
ncbi:MAG: hypothetical protein R3335_13115, partial [Anaerolineales bacterium]|nr:hypothetical protein [Anaerolineales bacterium]